MEIYYVTFMWMSVWMWILPHVLIFTSFLDSISLVSN
jgi:hypothetical protein